MAFEAKNKLKIRNFTSLVKLSHKRAQGRVKETHRRYSAHYQAMHAFEAMGLLTEDTLWAALEVSQQFFIEMRKLEYIALVKKDGIKPSKADMDRYVNLLTNTQSPLSCLPYELHKKYYGIFRKKATLNAQAEHFLVKNHFKKIEDNKFQNSKCTVIIHPDKFDIIIKMNMADVITSTDSNKTSSLLGLLVWNKLIPENFNRI